jgi:aspartate/glutamate racemase
MNIAKTTTARDDQPETFRVHVPNEDGTVTTIKGLTKATAKRITLCMNAMHGMPNEMIESMPGSVLDFCGHHAAMMEKHVYSQGKTA